MEPSRNEEDIRLRFQEKFDKRYVLSDGQWQLISKGFIGLCVFILMAVLTAILSFVIKSTP